MVVATARQVGGQVRVGERVWIHGLQFAVRGERGGFAIFVPIAKLLAPQVLREDVFGALEALGDFGLRGRKHLTVGETVHVAHLEAVNEQPVEAGEVVGTLLDCGGMHLLPIAGHRAREMHGV
jgi:hypothetical protein